MLIGGAIENPLSLSLGAHQARRAQQPQMVTGQRWGKTQLLGQVLHAHRLVEAGADQAQAIGVAQQMKGFRELRRLIGVEYFFCHARNIATFKHIFNY